MIGMRRDFTRENFDRFSEMIRSVESSDWCGLSDWFGDLFLELKHLLGNAGLYDVMADIDAYHREVLDMKNTSIEKLREIFEAVSAVDSRFGSSNGLSFGYVADTLRTYRRSLRYLSELNLRVSGFIESGGSLTEGCAMISSFVNSLPGRAGELSERIRSIHVTADNFHLLPDKYKREFIDQVELDDPETRALIDAVLSDPDLTDKEKMDIRFIIYNAPEPYLSIYLEHLKNYKVSVGPYKGSYYSPYYNEICLKDDDSTFFKNPRGPYNTFFHESGHAVDDFEDEFGSLTKNFEYDGRKLFDLIVEDTRNYVSRIIEKDAYLSRLTDEQKNALLRSLNLTDDASFSYGGSSGGLDHVLEVYRDRLIMLMKKDLGGDVNEAASDVYGGVTNNAITGSWGHYMEKGETVYTYWYSGKAVTHNQESELWAEFFAAQMTHDETALESIRLHFPQTYAALEAMAAQMAATG